MNVFYSVHEFVNVIIIITIISIIHLSTGTANAPIACILFFALNSVSKLITFSSSILRLVLDTAGSASVLRGEWRGEEKNTYSVGPLRQSCDGG
jgi:hypothetical protein